MGEPPLSGTMMTVTRFWTASLQVLKRGLHTLPQKPSSSQCIGFTVDITARRNSSRLCRRGKWCAQCSGTDWFQSQAADFYDTGIQNLIPRYVLIPEVNMLKNSSTLTIGLHLPINLSIKLDFVSVNGPSELTLWTRYELYALHEQHYEHLL